MQRRMDTGSGKTLPGGRIFFIVGCKLLSQTKVDCSHWVESWVRPPHGREDLSHRADVLLHAYFAGGIVVSRKDACVELVRKGL